MSRATFCATKTVPVSNKLLRLARRHKNPIRLIHKKWMAMTVQARSGYVPRPICTCAQNMSSAKALYGERGESIVVLEKVTSACDLFVGDATHTLNLPRKPTTTRMLAAWYSTLGYSNFSVGCLAFHRDITGVPAKKGATQTGNSLHTKSVSLGNGTPPVGEPKSYAQQKQRIIYYPRATHDHLHHNRHVNKLIVHQ